MKPFLLASIGISFLAIAGCLCTLILTVRTTVATIPAQVQDALAKPSPMRRCPAAKTIPKII